MNIIERLGSYCLAIVSELGRMLLFLLNAFITAFQPPFKFRLFLSQIRFFGARSIPIILLTGAFTGMVLGLQVYYTLRKFGSEALIGPAVGLSLIRELGPVFSALMVTGKAGSALTAEIGTMKISEQIDAMYSMALNPVRYLIVPNIAAGIVVFPLLGAIFNVVGIYGGYLVGVKLLGIGAGTYFGEMQSYVGMDDIEVSLYKSLSFGIIVTWICSYKGFYTGFGSKGVSKATTEAVTISSVLILVWDYFLGAFFI
ncbi:MAG TPA: MlaE family lipid ABC transporter permease subunit [Thermodesulfovibrionia bacterium]|nr:MlaE family lipid ABC transporter permease subunit [Thermodesulfovibrionia bacterium]